MRVDGFASGSADFPGKGGRWSPGHSEGPIDVKKHSASRPPAQRERKPRSSRPWRESARRRPKGPFKRAIDPEIAALFDGLTRLPPDQLEDRILEIRRLTAHPYGPRLSESTWLALDRARRTLAFHRQQEGALS
jgi:hypothetical protein